MMVKKCNSSVLWLLLLLVGLNGFSQSHYPGQHQSKLKLSDQSTLKAQAFDLQAVKLLDGPFKTVMQRESSWILSISVNRLLHSFRTSAGIYNGNEGGYFVIKKLGGWESLDCELRGHSTGHILSGLALLYASTGDQSYKTKADSIVMGLAEVQKVLDQGGYLSAFPQTLIDRNIAGQRVWAPWYTLHKIYAGLLDQYLYCNNQQALEIVEKMAAWAYQKLKAVTPDQRVKMIRNEFGGMNDAYYTLFTISGNPMHRELAEFFYHEEVLDPLKNGIDILEGKHANTYIPKLIGLARNFELSGEEKHHQIADFFWKTVVHQHSFCTGSNSDKEKFFKAGEQSQHLSGYTGETCNVYNMLKLTRHLYAANPEVGYMDFYEKALFNHILGQQDPATGMNAYFLPMLPGAHKVYSTPEQSFWCCVGSGFENHAKYGEAIYAHDENGLYLNLFMASELNWQEKGLRLIQETRFPEEASSVLTIKTAQELKLPIYIRYPSWAKWGAALSINGKKVKIEAKPGSYIVLQRNWKDGDQITFNFPMQLNLIPTPDNPQKAAIAYGPIVLAGLMGTAGMQTPAPYSNPELYNDYYTYDYKVPADLPKSLQLDPQRLADYILQEPGTLRFKAKNENIILEPIAQIHRQRYVIYWDLKPLK